MLSGAALKIKARKDGAPSEFEQGVAAELSNIENSDAAIKSELRGLQIVAARELEGTDGRKAAVIFVPHNQLQEYRRIQEPLIEELEKKMSGRHVVIVAQRTMLSKNSKRDNRHTAIRPRSRTLKHVQEAVLEDVVYPAEIVGKRTRCRVDGSRTLNVQLHKRDQAQFEGKLATFASVYQQLCGKSVSFSF